MSATFTTYAHGQTSYCRTCGDRVHRRPSDRRKWTHDRPQPDGTPHNHTPKPGAPNPGTRHQDPPNA